MLLPLEFQFSQSSLQDYVDCRQRFLLRHLYRLRWPAVEAEPALENEQAMQRGSQFHDLVRQHILGIPADRLTRLAQEEELYRWWQAYLDGIAGELKGVRYAEISLSMPMLQRRLLAKYDLLLAAPGGRLMIYDWKTSGKKMKRQRLQGRLQTRIYPYLLVQAGAFLNQGRPVVPEQVEMVYWFAGVPQEPVKFGYSTEQCQQDGGYLEGLVGEINSLSEADFFKTEHEERCRFCTYRSLCERGSQAGSLSDLDGWVEEAPQQVESFDFEQIAEIAF